MELLDSLIETAQYNMILIVQGDGRIIKSNTLARNTFGYVLNEILKKNIKSFLKCETPDANDGWEFISNTVQRELHWRGIITAICRDGRHFPAEIAISRPFNEPNMICFIRDITKEKEVDMMKSEFISIASHELRSPLTSIKNAIDLILNKKTGEITDVQEKFLSMAERNINRLIGLINDLLDISKIEAGKMELSYAETDMKNIIENAINTLRPLAEKKSITLNADAASSLPLVYADASKIEEVMINLIDNAIKFTPANGTITVDAQQIGRLPDMPDDMQCYVKVSVKDTGIGIPDGEKERLFTKFYQAESSLSGQSQSGTGLGLVICKGIIEAHGGKIQSVSKKGKGSTFSFLLPLLDEEGVCYKNLNDEILRARQQQIPLSILLIRIKDYERLKEICGQEESEKILERARNAIITSGVKRSDKIEAFPTNGEIILLMRDTDHTGTQAVQRRIEKYIAKEKIVIEIYKYSLSFIAGHATFPKDGLTAEELLDTARKKQITIGG